MPKRLSSIIASSRCTQSTLVDFITWPMRSMVFFVSDADDDIYRIISGRVFLATILSIWVLAEVRFIQFVITAIFRHKMLPKVMQRRVLKRYSGLHCVIFFVILILQLTADSAMKELWELVSMLPRHRYEHGVFLFPGAQCMLYNANRRRPVHLLLASLSTTGYSVSAFTSGRLNHIAHTRSDDETDRDEVLRAREL